MCLVLQKFGTNETGAMLFTPEQIVFVNFPTIFVFLTTFSHLTAYWTLFIFLHHFRFWKTELLSSSKAVYFLNMYADRSKMHTKFDLGYVSRMLIKMKIPLSPYSIHFNLETFYRIIMNVINTKQVCGYVLLKRFRYLWNKIYWKAHPRYSLFAFQKFLILRHYFYNGSMTG